MDLSSLTLPQRAILENLAHEDGFGLAEDWLTRIGFYSLTTEAITYFESLDTSRHIYVGENDIDYGRRINCVRIGCKCLRSSNLLP